MKFQAAPESGMTSDPRTLALRKQLEKMRTPFRLLFGPLAWFMFIVLCASGSTPLSTALVGSGTCAIVMNCTDIALYFRRHTDFIVVLFMSCMVWGGAAAFGLFETERLPPDIAAKMPLHHGGSFFSMLAVGNSFQLRREAFLVFVFNLLMSHACMRVKFVSTYGSPEDHMDTLSMLIFAGLCCFFLRSLRDEAFFAAVEFKKMKQHAEKQKHSFLAYIMHEVRNPLSASCLLMCEQSEVIAELKQLVEAHADQRGGAREGEEKERDMEDLQMKLESLDDLSRTVLSQIDQMGNICDDVLHLEKLASGTFEFSFSPGSVVRFYEETVREAAPVFKSKHLVFKPEIYVADSVNVFSLSEEEDVRVWADFARLKQVLSNFLSNARKFSPAGGAVSFRLEVCLLSESPSHSRGGSPHASHLPDDAFTEGSTWVRLRFSVKDRGVGLSEEDLPKLFKPYSQIRAGEQQNGGGTGLGLCISRVLVDAHCGGTIAAVSEGTGKGSEFFFEFDSPIVGMLPSDDSPGLSPSANVAVGGGSGCGEAGSAENVDIEVREGGAE
uniref:histidine kinase n=1 Tax=Chromera velia CCMP2878 TaxID=1169474 RepID=A0A0G4HZV3_9ALVE|eukprot:Cvel_9791.t1-p1 / transcript=Cvel_9791.t1 / gene=Cvel_9791 / organism=Chromera_velia_CCMP2878 / gene_product=Ethylene receptor, putative / transcript_product=Ethylene receptor, putative / location=Cvel_scaffold574:56439-59322(-) / protein_length=553 / sequence_SO=supercontig / SO=protein_coding / is_pseudo=false